MRTKNIKQEVLLPCSPQEAYNAWLDSKTHGKIINGNAVIDPNVNGSFSLWDGYLIGKTIELDEEKHKIVQEWRDDSTDWPQDHFSKISLHFKADGDQTKLIFNQTDIPEEHADSIADGWNQYYWEPMKKYFEEN